jgi:nitrite reductase/ring-hydroxylating ferredoxin subunit
VAALIPAATELRPLGTSGNVRSYAIPASDTILVDEANDLILARWDNRLYAFSLKCPHRGARLEWRAGEKRIFCPKHKARFVVSGVHDSGRQSRDLDRYAITRNGGMATVDLAAVLRADQDAVAWRAAVLAL